MKQIIVTIGLVFYFSFNCSISSASSAEDAAFALSQQAKITEDQAKEQIRQVFAAITAELQAGRPVSVRNFGRFHITEREPRTGRNPKTGEAIQIPKKRYPRFSSSENLKTLLNPEQKK